MSQTVVTFRYAYLDREVSLCDAHEATHRYPLGPVTHGAHRGTCSDCAAVGAILVHGLTGQDIAEEWLAAGTACEVEEQDEEWATILVDGYRYRVLPSDLTRLSVQA